VRRRHGVISHNYLNKVVGQRRVGERIFFQGGTAFNQGVVAAFEKVVGRPVTVPPHHDVTGAIGAAILAKRENSKGYSDFKGFDLSRKKYTINTFGCRECSNMCEIRKVTVEGDKPIFYGSRCEKYEVAKEKKRASSIPDLFAEREELLMNIAGDTTDLPVDAPVVGIPRSLFLYEHYPFWKTFFSELGFRVELSDETSKQIIHQGVETVVAEFCFPVKVAHGHVLDLINKGVKRIFLPSVVDMPKSGGARNSFNCPYVQTFPYTVRSAIDFEKLGVEVLSPPVYFGRGEKMLRKSMMLLGRSLGVSPSTVKKSLAKARRVQDEFFSRLVERGREVLSELGPQDRALVVISRPYNGCDSRINLNLPQKLRQLGVLPIPIDMMPWEEMPEEKRETKLYWKAGQRIIQTARLVKDDERLFAVYLTNFGCGPDSFISHFFAKEMEGKPYLQLEIDEHSADAGVVTRCEAFMDSLNNYRPEAREAGGNGEIKAWGKTYQKRTVYIPYMADQARAIVAAFQACGVDAEMMDESDAETLDIGRKHTSGRECYPCILTTGDMIKTLRRPGFDPDRSAFFMASGSGPCRFGQYHRLHRLILDELGYERVPLFSPNQDYDFYSDLGMVDNGFSSLGWQGIVAVDLLEKKLRETKPYEVNPGETEAIYAIWVAEVCDAIKRRKDVAEVLKKARRDMDAISISKEISKPVVGVVGEIYVRSNRFSNEHIVAKIEELGGEVWMPPMSEWFFYINHCSKRHSRDQGERREFLRIALKNWFQYRKEQEYYMHFRGSIRNLHEPTTAETLRRATPYIHSTYEGEAVLSVGKSTDYIHKGAAGIINAIPFTCMPGNIVSAVFKPFRQEHGGIPILNLSYDGQGKTNSQTRLEAFMYQVSQYQKGIHSP
jgi:predicted nucleotide-binding protein (sugar kinase/HSP70/actin superfamily)